MNEDMTVYDLISSMGKDEISKVLDHVLFCYSELFPQWSVSILSVDKREDTIAQIDETIALLQKLKENPHLLKQGVIKG